MKKIKAKIYKLILNMKLSTRMMSIYSILTLVIIAFMSFYFYKATVNLLKLKQRLALQDSLEYLAGMTNLRITEIDQHFLNLFQEEKFRSLYFETQKYDKDDVNQLMLGNKLRDYFTELVDKDNDIVANVILATSNGNVFSDINSRQYSYNTFINTEYREKTIKDKNKLVFVNSSVQDKYFSMARSFYYTASSNPEDMQVGIGSEDKNDYSTIVFLLKKSYIEDLVKGAVQRHKASILILDEDGDLVFKTGMIQDNAINEYIKYAKSNKMDDKGSYDFKRSGYNLIVNYEKIKYSDWHIVMVYNENILFQDAASILEIITFSVIIALFLTIVISYYVSRTVVKPIRKLVNVMVNTVENDMEVHYTTKYNDEIAYLGKAFNKMIVQIREMIHDIKKQEKLKRKEELKALQAQINPHFLYNTLDMVYLLAKAEKNDKVADIIADLGDFFRLSLNKGEDITTVNNEIEHAIRYLSIQKTRWNKKFDYEVTVQEDLRSKNVPKLVLQPLVENSLVHGLYNIDYKGIIKINVYSNNDKIIFSVEDNGIGIEKDVAEKIKVGEKVEKSKSGYAIRNVYERIKLYTGEEHNIDIKQKEEGGTIALISFPLNFEIREV